MNRLFLSLALALSLSTTVFAKNFIQYRLTGCTTDKQAVALIVTVNEDIAAGHPVYEHIAIALTNAASQLTSTELQSEVGFRAFISGLDEHDFAAIDSIPAPPNIVGTCK